LAFFSAPLMLSFTLWVLILAGLLFYPVSKLIWVVSVRRFQKKWGRELSPQELQDQLNRARVIAALVVLVFSFFYNLNTVAPPSGE
jgi:hypothetical protein